MPASCPLQTFSDMQFLGPLRDPVSGPVQGPAETLAFAALMYHCLRGGLPAALQWIRIFLSWQKAWQSWLLKPLLYKRKFCRPFCLLLPPGSGRNLYISPQYPCLKQAQHKRQHCKSCHKQAFRRKWLQTRLRISNCFPHRCSPGSVIRNI